MMYRVHDVLNYGGFFAGDTVTLTAQAVGAAEREQTITIDQGALTNVGGDRYKIVGGMALDLQFEGERVGAAALVAAPERATLRNAVTVKDERLHGPRLFSYYCKQCNLWILGEPHDGRCGVEGHEVSV
jgi:hypothetical protein